MLDSRFLVFLADSAEKKGFMGQMCYLVFPLVHYVKSKDCEAKTKQARSQSWIDV